MDNKLLAALNNLSVALQEISDSLNESKKQKETSNSSIVDALKSLDITTQLKSIDEGIKKIQSDNKEIIKDNKQIKEILKKSQAPSKDTNTFTPDGKQQKNIKDGVKMILLIAVGVLAIGAAFKILGNVDFKSVIALSIAMPLLAIAFEKISKVKTSLKDLVVTNLGLIMMATTIMLASKILQYVKPVSALQLLTVVFIAGGFALLSLSLGKLANGIKGVDVKNLWKMPLVLVAASAAIAASSYILQYVKPVGFYQLLTVVFIAGAFALLSFSLGKLTNGIKNIDTKDLWKLPLVLVAASAAIAASSHILQYVKPIGFAQFLTTILISAAFVVLSFMLPRLASAVKKVGIVEATMMPIVLIAMSGAIVASSMLLSNVQPIPIATLINIALQAVLLSVIGITLGFTIGLMSKMGVGIKDAALGSISLLILAGTIMASSQILSFGSYDKYPSLKWTLGVATSMLAFGIATSVLGDIIVASGGLGLGALALGALGILMIAGTIVGTDKILSMGKYDKFPSFEWSASVGLSMTTFGLAMTGLGVLIGGTLGLGYLALMAGASGIKLVAQTIVETATILSTGNFSGGPTLSWSLGTGFVMTAFGMSMMAIGGFIGGTLGLGYLALKAGSNAMKLIASSIVETSFILNGGNYSGGPTAAWSSGVGRAIEAFAPVFKTLNTGGLLGLIFGGGSSPEKMKAAIITISNGILTAADIFNKGSASFKGGPTAAWANGVGRAIEAFAPVYKSLSSGGILEIFTGSGASVDDMKGAIIAISESIVSAGDFFNKNSSSFGGSYPSREWSRGVGSAIEAFGPAFKWASDNSGWFGDDTSFLKRSIITVAESIVSVASILNGRGVNYNNPIPVDYGKTLSSVYSSFFTIVNDRNMSEIDLSSVSMMLGVAKSISDTSIALSKGNYKLLPANYMSSLSSNILEYIRLINYLKGSVSETKLFGLTINRASEISRMADDYDKLSDSIKNLSSSIQSIDLEKISALKTLTGSIVLMSLMDSDQFEKMMDSLEEKAKIFVDVIKDVEGGVSSKEISIRAGVSKESGPSLQDVLNLMSRMDTRLGQIASSNDNLSRYVNEIRTSKVVIKKK